MNSLIRIIELINALLEIREHLGVLSDSNNLIDIVVILIVLLTNTKNINISINIQINNKDDVNK